MNEYFLIVIILIGLSSAVIVSSPGEPTSSENWVNENTGLNWYDEVYYHYQFNVEHFLSITSGNAFTMQIGAMSHATDHSYDNWNLVFSQRTTGLYIQAYIIIDNTAYGSGSWVALNENEIYTVWVYGSRDLNRLWFKVFDSSGTAIIDFDKTGLGWTGVYWEPLIRKEANNYSQCAIKIFNWWIAAVTGKTVSSESDLFQEPFDQFPFKYAAGDNYHEDVDLREEAWTAK